MINSHYVPQFILRNFYADDKITYCDLEKKTIQPRNTRSVFSEEGYYPEGIEHDLCKKAEYQFANLYHNKLEEARSSITLTADELFTIKKYLVVCAVRYKHEINEEDEKRIELLGPAFKIDYDRFSTKLSYGDAKITITLETKGKEHQDTIEKALKDAGYEFTQEF